MGVMKDLIQQSADSINKMSGVVESLQKQMQAQQEAQSGKADQISGQIQSLNDSVDEIKARIASLQKLVQDVQSQQQSMNANMPNQPAGGSTSTPVNSVPDNPPPPAPIVRRGKPSAGIPPADVPASPAPVAPASLSGGAPPADELYKTALGDYMAAKYALAASEFGDVVKNYPDNPLSGNAYYYQAEIAYRGGKYAAAIKAYDAVIDQYPTATRSPSPTCTKAWRSSRRIRKTPAFGSSATSYSVIPTPPKPCRRAANSVAWASRYCEIALIARFSSQPFSYAIHASTPQPPLVRRP